MNNDYLRVNSKENEEGIVEGVYAVKSNPAVGADETPTLYSLFRHKKGQAFDFQGNFPDLTKALRIFLILALVSISLTLVAFSAKSVDFLVIVSFAISLVIPIVFIAVFYELNTMKNISFTAVFGGITIGVVYYFIMSAVTEHLVRLTFYYDWVEKFLLTPVFDAGLIAISYFYVKFLKKFNLFASFLIVVSVFAGFALTNAFIKTYGSLFSAVQLVGEKTDKVFALVRTEEYFDKVLTPFLVASLKFGLYESFLYALWSVIAGGVLSLRAAPLKTSRKDGSIYLLIVMQLILHVFENVGSVLPAIDIILSIICVTASVVVAFKILNFVMTKNPRGQ